MKGNVEAPGNGLSRDRVMGFPMNLGIEVVASRIEVPASNTNDCILVGTIDNLHIPNRGITSEASSLFVEVESQTSFRFFSCLHRAADWGWGAYEVIPWWVRSSVRYKLIKVLKL